MTTYLNLAQILVSLFLMATIILQAKGAGGVFGGQASVYQTRRGLEKTLFQLTIVLTIIFLAISIVSVKVAVP